MFRTNITSAVLLLSVILAVCGTAHSADDPGRVKPLKGFPKSAFPFLRLDRPVTDLSVGQQQRVAAARALIGSPEIVLADEPTSSLDRANSEIFIQLLFEECNRERTTIVFVSHDHTLAQLFDRSVTLREGHESTNTED